MLAEEFHWELPFPHHHWELSSAFSGRGLAPAPKKKPPQMIFLFVFFGANPALALQNQLFKQNRRELNPFGNASPSNPPAQLSPQTAAMSAACQHSRQKGWTCDERHHLEVKPWFTDQLKTILSGSRSPPLEPSVVGTAPTLSWRWGGEERNLPDGYQRLPATNAESAAEPEQAHICFPAAVLGDEATSGV